MLEKFKALAWHIQLIVLVAFGAFVYGGVYYSVTSATRAEVQALEDQIAQEYDELKVLLPEQREITNVLQGLQDTAGDSQLVVMRFSPREDQQQEYIMAKPVEIEVDSNFNNLRAFFDKMAKLQRIVSITDFKLMTLNNQTGNRTLHAQFLLTAYYASPEDLGKPAPAANGQKPGGPNQPAPNPAAPNAQPAAPAAVAK
jgi:Tfp pilus assembly protein PilO